MHKRTPGQWFLGQIQTDQDECDYDGYVCAPPTAEEVADAEASRGTPVEFEAFPNVVAKCDSKTDAEYIVRACNAFDLMLAALEVAAVAIRAAQDAWREANQEPYADFPGECALAEVEAAICKARGEG